VLTDDDKDLDENNDQIEKHDDLPEEKELPDEREVEEDSGKKFSNICKDKLDADGKCEIIDEVIDLTETVFFTSKVITSLVFNNTKIICATGKDKDEFCQVTMELKS
jgi:hypothetical protein